jgi:hypothetical protein
MLERGAWTSQRRCIVATVMLSLSPETERNLREKAGSAGMTLEGFLSQLAERVANWNGAPKATFDQILAPVRQGFAESGQTDAELAAEFEAARDEVWEAGHGRKPGA